MAVLKTQQANQKIVFPTDLGLLNTSRKESERIIDLLYEQSNLAHKPRDYRRIARTEYLIFSKKRKEQLLGMFSNIKDFYPFRFPLPKRDQKIYWVLQLIYEQQKYMYDKKKR